MSNLIEAAKTQIESLLAAAYRGAREKGTLPPGGDAVQGTIDIPRDVKNGDYASAWAMAAARCLKKKPLDVARAIAEELVLSDTYFQSVEIAGPGFLNFQLAETWYRAVLCAVQAEGPGYGRSDKGAGKKVMVEFVSANPTGLMTVGNARGGVLGDTMAAVLERTGYDVWREFYVNDAGNQVALFAQSLRIRYIQLLRGEDAAAFPENGYHGDDIKELARAFYEENGEAWLDAPEETCLAELERFGLERNIQKMQVDLERYGIRYDRWFRESELHKSGAVAETMALLQENGHTYEKDGALWLNLSSLGGEKDEVLQRANGLYTYFAVDLAYHRDKFQRGFDKVIDVLGADHHGHAIRFKTALPAIGADKDRLDFLIMQLVRLTRDGETVRVSKRTGKAITLSDLLDEIPRDAVRFFFNAKPDTHLEFDLALAIREDSENPVYYVQYAHARICSLIAMLSAEGEPVRAAEDIDLSKLDGAYERQLIKTLARFPDELLHAARDYDPSKINKYAQELAASFHGFYNNCRIKGTQQAVLAARLCLADATRAVLACALAVLGVSAPERM